MERANKPLTLEQLRGMIDKPAFLDVFDKDLPSGWQIIKAVTQDKIIFRGWQTVYVPISGMGIDYNLYAQQPAHIDREKWTAEWIYPKSEFSLPVCSKCGCNSKDAQYGHKDNFCPKCGRAMNAEAWAELERRVFGE